VTSARSLKDVFRENVLFLGGGRALLLQLAHPSVAAGVAEHSDFRNDPFTRLRRTIGVVDRIVFGSEEEATAASAALRAVHDRVVGDGYAANDPDLLFWVHATLIDTGIRIYNGFVAPLSTRDRERVYVESIAVAEAIGVPRSSQPASYSAFSSYWREMVGGLEVSDTARDVADAVLNPRLPLVAGPAFELVRQVTVGLLPRPIREQYGFRWDAARKAALNGAALASRTVHPVLPRLVRQGNLLAG
jgi:uncharacterized protein (DUF2236 family)